MKTEGERGPAPDCSRRRFAIVAARFYRDLTDDLIDGARRAHRDCCVSENDIYRYDVPGCFELPLACRNLIDTERFDGIVALGVVIRGDTPHFDFVAGECVRGIMDVQLATGIPIGFGVLTTENLAQAQERADPKRGDKGYEAAIAAATVVVLPQVIPATTH
ncbi:MAG: 6,7-dimethyl-8-ribityllumazine synthase [Vulcanimicrobiaceae bacterium]